MPADRWERIEALFDEALEIPTPERSAWLASLTAEPAVHAALVRMLAAHESADGPLHVTGERPAVAWAGPIVAQAPTGSAEGMDRAKPTGMPARIGPWQPRAVAGEGGMGTVYVADRVDGTFDMRVALKVVRRGLHGDDGFRRRFREERQILARLQHPGIARLLDAGVTDDGTPYYVMEFIDGRPIDRYCNEQALSREGRIALMAQVCDAVADAHAARVVHRDIKPGNILVTAEGAPKLLDFGIAKLLHDDADAQSPSRAMTRTGQRLLTPAYASPEQLRGDPITPASDVWALGIILHELLTLQHPFDHGDPSPFELEQRILAGSLAPPSRVGGRALRGDLDAIVLTALQADPARRYADAALMAEDLRRHLAGRPVQARRDSRAYTLARRIARHRVAAMAGALGMLLGVALLIVANRTPLRSDNTSASTVAARFHERGLAALAMGRYGEATRHFASALEEDSTFAMAAFYGAEAASRDEDFAVSQRMREIARREARRAAPADRLLIEAYLAERDRSPAMHALADSLLRLKPQLPKAHLLAARAAFWRADYAQALERYRWVGSLDSGTARAPGACDACEARTQYVNLLIWMDSLDAAEREGLRITRVDSTSADAWRTLALAELYHGRVSDRAYKRALELDPGAVDWSAEWLAGRYIRQGRFAQADEILRAHMATVPKDRRVRSHWLLITSLRNQERWEEAFELAREFRALGPQVSGGAPEEALHEAIILLEQNLPLRSAALFDSMSRTHTTFDRAPTLWPSTRLWHLTHAAEGYALAGDTNRVKVLVDSLRLNARFSGLARDQRLWRHVQGLLLAARGEHERAVEEFRAASISPNVGYTRTNLALSRSLLALGRAEEAVRALQPALRGSLEVNNLYVTHTALHEALATAWTAAGNADSARVHIQWVQRARRLRDSPAGGARRSPPPP